MNNIELTKKYLKDLFGDIPTQYRTPEGHRLSISNDRVEVEYDFTVSGDLIRIKSFEID